MADTTTDEATSEQEHEVDALGGAGTNPAVTDPGDTDIGTTGGGKATPDPGAFENQASLGDNESLSDDTDMSQGIGQDDGDLPEGEETRALPSGYVIATDDSDMPIGGVPTGGLPTGGTIGGIPTGGFGSSFDD